MNIEFDFGAVLSEWPLLLRGVAWTVGLTAVGTVLGMVVGAGCGWWWARMWS
jgi:polar amino acid transport system permease protein